MEAGRESTEAVPVSAGVVLEVLTQIPAPVFDALPPVAQAAVVARIVPDRLRSLDVSCAEAVLVVTQRAANSLGAMQDLVLAACVRHEELDHADLDGDEGDGSEHRPSSVKLVASSVAPLLRSTPRACEARVARALCLVDELPRTLALALDGRLSRQQCDVVADQAQLVAVGARSLFDAAVTDDPEMTTMTPLRLRGLCERAATAVDPAAVENRAELGLRDRFVRLEPGVDPGMAWWRASIPSLASAQAWAAIDELAHEYVRADPSRTIDQARADAFVDLLLGHADVSTTVELVVPTCLGAAAADAMAEADVPPAFRRAAAPSSRPEGWAAVPGLRHIVGPALATEHAIGSQLFGGDGTDIGGFGEESLPHVLMLHDHESRRRGWDALADRMRERHGVELGRWRPPELGVRDPRAGWILAEALVVVLTDPDVVLRLTRADARTGVTVARDPLLYRPNAALAQRVRDRDRTCRFPGCGVAARRCDLDHVRRFPDGTTTEDNLVSLCRTHHGFKHHAGWTLTITPSGTCTWTSPTGRSHVTQPADVRLDAA